MLALAGILASATIVFVACGGGGSSYGKSGGSGAATATPESTKLTVTSTAFEDGGTIPTEFTCAGAGTSPQIAWSGAPSGTQAYALIMDDPDAPLPGGFTHWVVYDLPASTTSLDAGAPEVNDLAGGKQGQNGRGTLAYTGPCPPAGSPHHYHFRVYALDAPLGIADGAGKDAVVLAMKQHAIADGEIVGLFGR